MEGSQEMLAVVVVAAPILVGVIQGLKSAGITSSRWAMPTAVILGVAICLLVGFTDLVDGYDMWHDWAMGVLAGVAAGLSASGLYSGVQRVAGQP